MGPEQSMKQVNRETKKERTKQKNKRRKEGRKEERKKNKGVSLISWACEDSEEKREKSHNIE